MRRQPFGRACSRPSHADDRGLHGPWPVAGSLDGQHVSLAGPGRFGALRSGAGRPGSGLRADCGRSGARQRWRRGVGPVRPLSGAARYGERQPERPRRLPGRNPQHDAYVFPVPGVVREGWPACVRVRVSPSRGAGIGTPTAFTGARPVIPFSSAPDPARPHVSVFSGIGSAGPGAPLAAYVDITTMVAPPAGCSLAAPGAPLAFPENRARGPSRRPRSRGEPGAHWSIRRPAWSGRPRSRSFACCMAALRTRRASQPRHG